MLKAWKIKTGGRPADLVVPPLRIDGQKVDDRTRCDYFRFALEKTGLARPGFGSPPAKGEKPEKVWYWCTRHTFAGHWVLQGNTIEVLSNSSGTIPSYKPRFTPIFGLISSARRDDSQCLDFAM